MKIAILHKWLKSKHTLMICHLGWEAPRSDLQRSLSKSPLQRWPKRLHLWPRTVQWSSALWVTLTCLFLTTGWLALPAKSIRTKCLSLPRSMPRFSRLMSVGLATPCSSHLPLILRLAHKFGSQVCIVSFNTWVSFIFYFCPNCTYVPKL